MLKITNKCTICSKRGHDCIYCPNKKIVLENQRQITKLPNYSKKKRKKTRRISSLCESSSDDENPPSTMVDSSSDEDNSK